MRIVLLTLLMLALVACGGQSEGDIEGTVQARVEATVGAQPAPEGKVIKEWSGNGTSQTEAFTIDAPSWGIEWDIQSPSNNWHFLGFGFGSRHQPDSQQPHFDQRGRWEHQLYPQRRQLLPANTSRRRLDGARLRAGVSLQAQWHLHAVPRL